MSAVNRSLRTATKQLRSARLTAATAPLATAAARSASFGVARASSTPSHNSFSTTTARKSGAPAMSQQREYDPEIKDIADYVANKPIDSDLAVSLLN